MKYFFGVDVETTGQFFTKNAMIAIGCSIMNEKGEEVENFVGCMKVPEGRTWEDRCVNEFWLKQQETLDDIKKVWESPDLIMLLFSKWLNSMDLKYGEDLILLSNFGNFDFSWIDTYLSEFTDRRSIYYRLVAYARYEEEKLIPAEYDFRRTWCTNSVYHGALLEKTGKYEEWNLEKKNECQNTVWKNDHNPLNDARKIASDYIIFYNKCIKKE